MLKHLIVALNFLRKIQMYILEMKYKFPGYFIYVLYYVQLLTIDVYTLIYFSPTRRISYSSLPKSVMVSIFISLNQSFIIITIASNKKFG